jgi:molybdopterin/thiamine biosynthesis adenylyltransferase
MSDNFLHRTRALLGDRGLEALAKPRVAIAGLGGVGGAVFMTLLRCGVKHFRLAENGIFDPPDMNRQWGALGSTIGEYKLDVYARQAHEINPEIELELFPEGINIDNIEDFLIGADIYVGVIDAEKGKQVKNESGKLCHNLKIPVFTAGSIGFGSIMINFHPDRMGASEFFTEAMKKSDRSGILPSYLEKNFSATMVKKMTESIKKGSVGTSSVGASQAGIMLASEVIAYIFEDTELEERKAIFAPQYVTVDLLRMSMQIETL